MKKLALVFLALLIVAGSAFAQDIGAWGRAIFVPAMAADEDTESALGTSWSGDTMRIGMTLSGSSDQVGYQIDVNADGSFNLDDGQPGNVTFGDQQKIWVKPSEMLKISVGNIYDDTYRGNGTFGSFDWNRASFTGEDLTFTRIITNEHDWSGRGAGAVINVMPVEGMMAYAAMSTGGTTEDMFKNGQYGAGYDIEDIGTLRAQYLGAGDDGTIEAAFKVTAVEGLYADVGVKVPTADDSDATVALYANYAADAVTVHGLGSFVLGDDLAMDTGIGVDYDLGDGLGASADVRYKNDIQAGNEDGKTDFFAGITKGLANGLVGIGFQGTTTNFVASTPTKTESDAFAWAIPVRLEYWF